MKQLQIIQTIAETIALSCPGINAALLIGSFANGNYTLKSDVDLSLWVDEQSFDFHAFRDLLRQSLSSSARIITPRQNIVVFFEDSPKLEIHVFYSMEALDLYFLGSEIKDIQKSIIFVKDEFRNELVGHLNQISLEKLNAHHSNNDNLIKELIDKFIYDFENASCMHRRSDNYRFYFNYNLALHDAIRLRYLISGKREHLYLPKKMGYLLDKDEQSKFVDLSCILCLTYANHKKRTLLDFFYKTLKDSGLYSSQEFNNLVLFLESIYLRDYLWNFRDISSYNPACKSGIIFRSSSFTAYQHDPTIFIPTIVQNNINIIVDLRTDEEISEAPYDMNVLANNGIKYLHLPVNMVPDEKEYQRFASGNKHLFTELFTRINPAKDVVLIHCVAGKDRTGVVCALLALLAGEQKINIVSDYLASEMDADIKYINAFLEAIDGCGGVDKYLLYCGLNMDIINHWKICLTNE